MLKKLSIIVLTISSAVTAGFDPKTLVVSNDSFTPLHRCQSTMKVRSLDPESVTCEATVMAKYEREVGEYTRITLQDGTIINASVDQNFYVPCKWVSAGSLSTGDALMSFDSKLFRIKSVELIEETVIMQSLSVPSTVNYFVTKHGLVVHNGAIGATVGGSLGFWVPTIAFNGFYTAVGLGSSALVGPVAGGTIALTVRVAVTPVQVAVTKFTTLWGALTGAIFTGPV